MRAFLLSGAVPLAFNRVDPQYLPPDTRASVIEIRFSMDFCPAPRWQD